MSIMGIRKTLAHLSIVFAAMFLTFFIIDRFNGAMRFIDNSISKWLLCLFTLTAMAQSILDLVGIRKYERKHQ